ncbi:type I-E CRISPR-associated protein Cas5/CasD [Streptomyces sp. NPDC005483]|uniref:type I-E CRISPR-associated protein Cas5/CasD n=1 Tax=Streptomyces sp. NPDC005483 TaxID=3154882 RepID=UPI00339E429D
MPTLLMRFDAPMQSWGTRSKFARRDTGTEPTKSGVVGLLAAALGVSRDDERSISELAQLRMGVRVDREGIVEQDFHTVQNVPNTEGKNHRTVVTERYDLAHALFLGPSNHPTTKSFAACTTPFCIRAGRCTSDAKHSYPLGRSSAADTGSLQLSPMKARRRAQAEAENEAATWLRTVVDADPSMLDVELRYDHPITFSEQDRRYAPRAVQISHVPLTSAMLDHHDSLAP